MSPSAETPMSGHNATSIATTLLNHWRAGTKLKSLPEDERPQTRRDGYAAQTAMVPLADAAVFGWKIAATSEAGQKHINVSGPLGGRIYVDRVIAEGGFAPIAGNEMRVAEPEFAFRFGRALPPLPKAYPIDEVLDAVATLHPAIELPDSRFSDFVAAGEAQLIADNACAHLFVLGPAAISDWRSVDLVEEKPVVTMRGRRFVGHGRNVLGDPRVALTWLVNELRQLGIPIEQGQVVTTGTCHPPLPIAAGDHIDADFGQFGKVSVSIV